MANNQPSLKPIVDAIDEVVKQIRPPRPKAVPASDEEEAVVLEGKHQPISLERQRVANVLESVKELVKALCEPPDGKTDGFEPFGHGGG